MKVIPLAISDVILIEPKVFGEDRGFFFESFNQEKFETAIGRPVSFVQDNHSCSAKNVLRGLHYQIQQPQGKLVRLFQGTVFDLAVDICRSLPNFGQHVAVELSAENNRILWAPEFERSIALNDPAVAIQWPIQGEPSLFAKDQQAKALAEAKHFA